MMLDTMKRMPHTTKAFDFLEEITVIYIYIYIEDIFYSSTRLMRESTENYTAVMLATLGSVKKQLLCNSQV